MGIIAVLIAFYSTLYSTRLIFPNQEYNSKLNKLFNSQLIETQVTKRTPTGWLADSATECLTLGVGSQKIQKATDVFLDQWNTPVNDYNPCKGLAISSGFISGNYETASYSRYWHGHAVVTQWLILGVGLPNLKNLIWAINITLIFYLGSIMSLTRKRNRFSLLGVSLVGPYFLFSDQAELHNSITHLYSSVALMLTCLIFLRNHKRDSTYQIRLGTILGSLYCFFLFGLSPQSIPIAIISWAGIYLIFNEVSLKLVLRKILLFLGGWIFGYLSTFISKWVIVSLLTDFPIWKNAQAQLIHRSSQTSEALSDGVGAHLLFAKDFPAFIQSWIANLSAFMIHTLDPRYSNLFLVLLVAGFFLVVMAILVLKFIKGWKVDNSLTRNLLVLNTSSLFFLLFWYTGLAQHSYDHATYTFRSIPIWFGGIFASLVLMSKKVKK